MLKNKINGAVCSEKLLLRIYTEAFRCTLHHNTYNHVQENPIIYLHALSGVRAV